MARIIVYRRLLARRNQRFRWRLVASNGKKICHGGEGYANRPECIEMAKAIVSGAYADAEVTEEG